MRTVPLNIPDFHLQVAENELKIAREECSRLRMDLLWALLMGICYGFAAGIVLSVVYYNWVF